MARTSLTSLIEENAPEAVILRGTRYFRDGRVENMVVEDDYVEAEVRGSHKQRYITAIEMHGSDEIVPDCDCPAFDSSHVCKHVYALAMAADEKMAWSFGGRRRRSTRGGTEKSLSWRDTVEKVRTRHQAQEVTASRADAAETTQLLYYIDAAYLNDSGHANISVLKRSRKKNGEWGKPVNFKVNSTNALQSGDRSVLSRLVIINDSAFRYRYEASSTIAVESTDLVEMLPDLLDTGRLFLTESDGRFPEITEQRPLLSSFDESWEFQLKGTRTDNGCAVKGALVSGGIIRAIDRPLVIFATGMILWPDRVTGLSNPRSFGWLTTFREQPRVVIPEEEMVAFVQSSCEAGGLPPIKWPADAAWTEESGRAEPIAVFDPPRGGRAVPFSIRFRYGEQVVTPSYDGGTVAHAETRRLVRRDQQCEWEAVQFVLSLGGEQQTHSLEDPWLIPSEELHRVVGALMDAGWEVRFDQKKVRKQSEFGLSVKSGVDWFDVKGDAQFDDIAVALPELLKAQRMGSPLVQLPDGSLGFLSDTTLQQTALLQRIQSGEGEDGKAVRFKGANAVMLDILLNDLPAVNTGEKMSTLRKQIAGLETPVSAVPVKSFLGTLRAYQQEGLGWMRYLSELSLGGCLADDMGLGKTVQVLALLEERRIDGRGQSLVVLPKSLMYNWEAEAKRFCPGMRVLQHAGSVRGRNAEAFAEYDLILISYQTLLRDIPWIGNINFDYVVLDESQAIKNPTTGTHKAALLLQSGHRLCMTGTPVENRLTDLWSQLQFLNPGLFDLSSWQRNEASLDELDLVARGVRPFILRRSKEQVMDDLPPKVEETMFCELPPAQRKLYDELKEHYRANLAQKVESDGLNKSKIMVLEALLRLRQTACHPVLVDSSQARLVSAKEDMLFNLLDDILGRDHKVLVFSQFTTLLRHFQERMDEREITYAYLDGQTRDREAVIDRFQNDPDCGVFLISLKAGGVGLNLTAADYVIILDPWWNPAIEAQAVDRAHRIGQTKRVFAYRMVAKDTIEEKILELQERKKALADAIMQQENSVLTKLTTEDLDYLLS